VWLKILNEEAYNPLLREFSIYPCVKTKLTIGVGCVESVGKEARGLGAAKALIVTDPGIVKAGLVDKVKKPLEEEGVEYSVFDECVPEPNLESWEKVTNTVRKGTYDLIIGLGGGSAMDTAKATAVAATNPRMPWEYLSGSVSRPLDTSPLSTIQIPTTSGTGSEISAAAVVIDEEGYKDYIFDNRVVADVALVDPLMTISLPPKTTATTGFDVLAHVIGALMARNASPYTDAIALKSVELVAHNLRTAYAQGDNIIARYNMAIASNMGGFTLLNASCALDHVLGHALGSKFHIPHGLSCAISLPYAMEFNLPAIPEKFALIAQAMGEDIRGLTVHEAGEKAVKAVIKLAEDVNIPLTLKEIGISKNRLERVVDDIITDKTKTAFLFNNNARKIKKDDLLRLLDRMWEGE